MVFNVILISCGLPPPAAEAAAAAAAVAAADEPWGPAAEGSAQPDVKRQAATVEQGPKEGAAAERGGGSRQPR